MKYVIVGSGVAGVAAVEAIRSIDKSGEILLISNDPHGHYSRPGLAYYLSGEIPAQALFSREPGDFQRLHVRYIHGHVKQVLRDQGCLEIEEHVYIPYDRLLLSLGACATPLEVPGSQLEGVFKVDHLGDAHRIIKSARRGRTAVVVGGGITALELVEGFVARGMKVHYLMRGDRYWSNVLDFHESKIVEQHLEQKGVQLHHHAEMVEISGKRNRVNAVRLKDGGWLHCELLGYAIGVQPQTYLAKQARLRVDRGILVNEFMQTNDPYIYAAGDVAQVYDPFSGCSVIESLWTPAREQGTTAGLNMAGGRKAYVKSVPFNVTRLAGLTTTIIGLVGQGKDQDLIGIARGDSETWRQLPDVMVAQTGFDVNWMRVMVGKQTLLGAVIMGDQTLSTPLQKIIANRVNISRIRNTLLSPNANVSDILAGFWTNIRERGYNVQELTIPRNLHTGSSASPSVQMASQNTIPGSIRIN